MGDSIPKHIASKKSVQSESHCLKKKKKSDYRNDEKQNSVEEVTSLPDPIAQQQEKYLIILIIGKAGGPAHTSDVSSCHFDNIQSEGLLYEDNVILCDSKAVVVAGVEQRARRDGANHFQVLETRLLLLLFWRWMIKIKIIFLITSIPNLCLDFSQAGKNWFLSVLFAFSC